MIYFLEIESINKSLLTIKKELRQADFLIHLKNEQPKEIFDIIDENLIKRKIIWQGLTEKTLIPSIKINSYYHLIKHSADLDLESFFIDCFKGEWDENVSEWMREFKKFNQKKEILILKNSLTNEIASSVMYWVFEDYIYIYSYWEQKRNIEEII